jgi:hypothetical protein
VGTKPEPDGEPSRTGTGEDAPRSGPILVVWVVLTFVLQAALWVSGARTTALSEAVEAGAAKVETREIGEVGDDVVRKAIALQQDTRTFWTVLIAFGDFVVEPLSLPLRAGLVAVLFAGIALLRGRKSEFASGMAGCAVAQGFWVLGLAVRAGLCIALKRAEIETSPTLLLPPGVHPGAAWVALRQLDVFVLLGWVAMARTGIVRMRIGWVPAVAVCVVLFLIEALFRIQFSLVIEAGMRLSLLPET